MRLRSFPQYNNKNPGSLLAGAVLPWDMDPSSPNFIAIDENSRLYLPKVEALPLRAQPGGSIALGAFSVDPQTIRLAAEKDSARNFSLPVQTEADGTFWSDQRWGMFESAKNFPQFCKKIKVCPDPWEAPAYPRQIDGCQPRENLLSYLLLTLQQRELRGKKKSEVKDADIEALLGLNPVPPEQQVEVLKTLLVTERLSIALALCKSNPTLGAVLAAGVREMVSPQFWSGSFEHAGSPGNEAMWQNEKIGELLDLCKADILEAKRSTAYVRVLDEEGNIRAESMSLTPLGILLLVNHKIAAATIEHAFSRGIDVGAHSEEHNGRRHSIRDLLLAGGHDGTWAKIEHRALDHHTRAAPTTRLRM